MRQTNPPRRALAATGLLAMASVAILSGPETAFAGGKHASQAASVAYVPVQTQAVVATPVVVSQPLISWPRRAMLVNTVAPAQTVSFVSNPTQTVSVVQGTASTNLVSVAQAGQLVQSGSAWPGQSNGLNLQVAAASLTQNLVAESVSATETPYLAQLNLVDAGGKLNPIGGLLKGALRKFLQSFGTNLNLKDIDKSALLKQIAVILFDVFVGNNSVDRGKASGEIDTIIKNLLDELRGGGKPSNDPVSVDGKYTFDVVIDGKTYTGTVNLKKDDGSGPAPPPGPNNNGASDPNDRDQRGPSRSPF